MQNIVPMLVYEDAPAAIEFLVKAYGFEERFRFPMPDGRLGHAELALGGPDGDIVMLSSEYPEMGLSSPKRLPTHHCQIHCAVKDVDAHYEHARAAGATIVSEPEDQFHGSRQYRSIDPEGTRWIFSTRLRDVSIEEMQKMAEGAGEDSR